MQVYVFSGKGDHYGFTRERSGENLPPEFGEWKFMKEIDLQRDRPRIAMDVNEAADDIEEKGWHVNRATVTFELKNA